MCCWHLKMEEFFLVVVLQLLSTKMSFKHSFSQTCVSSNLKSLGSHKLVHDLQVGLGNMVEHIFFYSFISFFDKTVSPVDLYKWRYNFPGNKLVVDNILGITKILLC